MRSGLDLARLRVAMRIAKVRVRDLLFPVALSFLSALLGTIGFGLVVPLATGLANKSFKFAEDIPVLGWVIERTSSVSNAFVVLVIAIVVCSLANILLRYWSGLARHERNSRIDATIKGELLRRLLGLSRRYFDERNQGVLTEVISSSGSIVSLFGAVQGILANASQLVFRLALIVLLSWKMALAVGVALVILDLLLRRLRARLLPMATASRKLRDDLSRQLFNMLSSIDLVKAYAMEESIRERYEHKHEELRKVSYRSAVLSGLTSPIQDTMKLVTLALLVVAGAWAVGLDATDRMAELIVLFWVAQSTIPYFGGISSALGDIDHNLPKIDALLDVFEHTDAYVIGAGDQELVAVTDKIELAKTRFSYGDTPVLDGLDLEIRIGKVTALVGKTGSGKSTVAKLLVRLYDCSPAQILIDGTDIRAFTLGSLRRAFAYVGQNVVLFDDSARANLTFGLPTVPDDGQLWDALRRVELEETLRQRPGGLDARVGDHGLQLSGGERQRLALARALLHDAPILVLDEATSALDMPTERRILREVGERRRDRTTLFITHRLAAIREADVICVLDGGKIVEQGTFDELMAARGWFHSAWET